VAVVNVLESELEALRDDALLSVRQQSSQKGILGSWQLGLTT